ncbi:MAG: carbohydrate ABC transporter permease [Hyphomicrobiaceae bacterium]
MEQLILGLLAATLGVGGSVAYFFIANSILDRIYPVSTSSSNPKIQSLLTRNMRISGAVRPWLFVLPALLFLTTFLVYPIVKTAQLSFFDASNGRFVAFDNWQWLFFDAGFHEAMLNNTLWLIVVPTLATFLGLVIAGLTDRIWWGRIAQSVVLMPMAISFVGASVIWKFVYDYRAEGGQQIGLLNAIVVFFGGEPQAWITLYFWNNFFLMVILIWMQAGFAMVILAAALRAVPEETIEAAVIDGAGPVHIFFRIKIPQIWGAIGVVWTTITILVLKVFDIVFALTNAQWNTEVLANLMFSWMFRGGGHFGRGAAIALVIMLLVIPIMIWNIRRANLEMKDH